MTNQEAIEAIKLARSQVEWDYPMDYAAAFDKAIEALEQEPVIRDNGVKNELNRVKDELEPTTNNDLGVDCVSRQEVDRLARIYLKEPTDNHVAFYEDFLDLPSVTPQLSSELEKNSKLEKIRDQLKSNLRGVEITLEVLVENDPLRPKMEGAKTTLEDCLELIEQAEAESI